MGGALSALARHLGGVRHDGRYLGARAGYRPRARRRVRRAERVANPRVARHHPGVCGSGAECAVASAGVRVLRHLPAARLVHRGVLDRRVRHRDLSRRLYLRGRAKWHRLHPSGAVRGCQEPGLQLLAVDVPDHSASGCSHYHAPSGRAGREPGEEHLGARAHRGRRAYVLLELLRRIDQLLRTGVRGGCAAVLHHVLSTVAPCALPGAAHALASPSGHGRCHRRAGRGCSGSDAGHA